MNIVESFARDLKMALLSDVFILSIVLPLFFPE